MPKLSIITINFNNATGLRKTIESVVKQTFRDCEYLVIDGGSTDGSIEIIKKYSDKITYWVSEADKGIFYAMNKGIEKATGDYCLFLNSGDYLKKKNIIEKFLGYENGEDIIYGNEILETKYGMRKIINIPEKLELEYFTTNSINHPSTLIKRKLFEEYGLYNESNRIVSDWEFFIKTIIVNKVKTKKVPISISVNEVYGISGNKDYDLLKKEEMTNVLNKYSLQSGFQLKQNNEKSINERIKIDLFGGLMNILKYIFSFRIKIKN